MRAALVAALLVLAAFDLLARLDAPQQLPLVRADYPFCVTIHPPPLQQRSDGINLYPRRRDVA